MTLETISGQTWIYERKPLNEVLCVKYRAKVWFLFSDCVNSENYHGNFKTKKEMYEYIRGNQGEKGGHNR